MIQQTLDVANEVTSGPWWGVVIASVISAILAAGITAWTARRRDTASNEQTMIDQLQEETKSLRKDLTELSVEVRTLRVREIAWITHTSTLTQIVAIAGQAIPPLPEELRHPIPVKERP